MASPNVRPSTPLMRAVRLMKMVDSMMAAQKVSTRASLFTNDLTDIVMTKIMKASNASPRLKVDVYKSFLKAIMHAADEGFKSEMDEVRGLLMVLRDDVGCDVKPESTSLAELEQELNRNMNELEELERQSQSEKGAELDIETQQRVIQEIETVVSVYERFDKLRSDLIRLAKNVLPRLTREIGPVNIKELTDLFLADPFKVGIDP